MDMYWGGPERRITGLTVRIIGVNALALIILLIGVVYLGQYQKSLIEAKLATFEAEVKLVAAAISESSMEAQRDADGLFPNLDSKKYDISAPLARRMVRRLSQTMNQDIKLFNNNGLLIADSRNLIGPEGTIYMEGINPPDKTLYSIQVLKSMVGFVLKLLPDRKVLQTYPDIRSEEAIDYPDVPEAMRGMVSISAWNNEHEAIFLSAAAPLYRDREIIGSVLLTREARDIERDMGEVWLNILRAFGLTLVITILLSIYLSGTIARPLRKLAKAAEAVRTGKSNMTEIPDLSRRHDEIGELSLVLRDMTQALWDRMDSIERFAADVAHELKNPLTSLRSAIETLPIVREQKDRDKLTGILKHDVERLDRLIGDISSASRLDTELSREAMTRISLRSVLHHLIDAHKGPLERNNRGAEQWSNSAKTRGGEIRLDCTVQEDLFVWSLEGRLTQVFENLISNALSFSPEGGIVSIHVEAARHHAVITVSDQGPGIPENKMETIFERFYSERPQHEDYGTHSGLGLSICRQIVSALGGQIFAENIKNSSGAVTGARFTVILGLA